MNSEGIITWTRKQILAKFKLELGFEFISSSFWKLLFESDPMSMVIHDRFDLGEAQNGTPSDFLSVPNSYPSVVFNTKINIIRFQYFGGL